MHSKHDKAPTFYAAVQVESLYPAEMGSDAMNVEEFLANGVLQLDNHLADRVEKAASKGNVLRYVCVIEGSRYY